MFLDEAKCISTIEVVTRCAKLACRRRGQTYPDGQIALELGSAHDGWVLNFEGLAHAKLGGSSISVDRKC